MVGCAVLDAGVLEAAVCRKRVRIYVNMMSSATGRRQENSRIPILRVWLSKLAVASTGLSGLSSRAYSAQLAQAEEYVTIDTRSTDAWSLETETGTISLGILWVGITWELCTKARYLCY